MSFFARFDHFLAAGRRDPLAVVLFAALLILPGLGNRDLWNPDEPRYAEVTREMLDTGQVFVPHLNGEMYTQKPPLLFWSMGIAALLTGGLDETAARLPSAAAAIATTLLVFLMGRLLFNRRAGWIAAAAFLTCVKILWQARTGQIDMLLGFCVAAAMWMWIRGWVEDRPELFKWFFVLTGLATVAKGPAGFLPPLLGIVAFLAWQRDWARLKQLRIGRGFLIWGAVVLAWLAPAILVGGDEYMQEIVFKQNVGRYLDPWHHFKPWYYYLTVIPGDFFPWALLLPASIAAGWKGLVGETRKGFLFALCWMAATVVFFSISPAKRSVYILSMYPAMALLVGAGLDLLSRRVDLPRLGELGFHRRWLTWPLGFVAVIFLAVTVAAPILGPEQKAALPMGPRFPLDIAVITGLAALGAAIAWWQALRGRVERSVLALAGGMGAAGLFAFLVVVPQMNITKSARPMAERLVELAHPDEPYGIYPRPDAAFYFYSHRFSVPLHGRNAMDPEQTAPRLKAFLERAATERIWLLIERDDLEKLQKQGFEVPLVEVARDGDIVEGHILMTSPPWPRAKDAS